MMIMMNDDGDDDNVDDNNDDDHDDNNDNDDDDNRPACYVNMTYLWRFWVFLILQIFLIIITIHSCCLTNVYFFVSVTFNIL